MPEKPMRDEIEGSGSPEPSGGSGIPHRFAVDIPPYDESEFPDEGEGQGAGGDGRQPGGKAPAEKTFEIKGKKYTEAQLEELLSGGGRVPAAPGPTPGAGADGPDPRFSAYDNRLGRIEQMIQQLVGGGGGRREAAPAPKPEGPYRPKIDFDTNPTEYLDDMLGYHGQRIREELGGYFSPVVKSVQELKQQIEDDRFFAGVERRFDNACRELRVADAWKDTLWKLLLNSGDVDDEGTNVRDVVAREWKGLQAVHDAELTAKLKEAEAKGRLVRPSLVKGASTSGPAAPRREEELPDLKGKNSSWSRLRRRHGGSASASE